MAVSFVNEVAERIKESVISSRVIYCLGRGKFPLVIFTSNGQAGHDVIHLSKDNEPQYSSI